MNIEILNLAQLDLIDGYRFYENQELGLGNYFLDTLYSDIDSLRIYGGIHSIVFKNLHRALSKRFPFAIYYTVESETVRVRAILDCRRNPSWIREHLRKAQ